MKTTRSKILIILLILSAILAVSTLWKNKSVLNQSLTYNLKEGAIPLSTDAVQPIPLSLNLDQAKVALGRTLFSDVRLSGDDTVSCASCHVVPAGGSNNQKHAIGIRGQEGGINTPTILNSGFNFVQFWNGRAATLEEQAGGPVTNPGEMGATWPQVIKKLSADADYQKAFTQAYGGKITEENIRSALAIYERSLFTPNSRFDQYLRGNKAILTKNEAHGFELFNNLGCISCHQGINLGGNMYERMGMMADYFGDRGNITEADNGRYAVTHNETDRHYFKVPSLRNIALTAPYFHDGSAENLQDAVRIMAKYQLGRVISEQELGDLVEFLNTLTGEIDAQGRAQ